MKESDCNRYSASVTFSQIRGGGSYKKIEAFFHMSGEIKISWYLFVSSIYVSLYPSISFLPSTYWPSQHRFYVQWMQAEIFLQNKAECCIHSTIIVSYTMFNIDITVLAKLWRYRTLSISFTPSVCFVRLYTFLQEYFTRIGISSALLYSPFLPRI